MPFESSEHLFQMIEVTLEGGRVHDEIIEVDEQVVMDLPTQAALHESLESRRGVTKAKRHPFKLVQPHGCGESGLLGQTGQRLLDPGQWVGVLVGHGI